MDTVNDIICNVTVRRDNKNVSYRTACSSGSSVAQILNSINMTEKDPIEWECSCRQGLCGACAMVINGRPALACISFVRDIGTDIRLEPLSKFPLIKDLKVDRSGIGELLQKLKTYPVKGGKADPAECDRQYLASSCIMCGCCMEVCPNFTGMDDFGSALAANAMFRTISQETDNKRRRELTSIYKNSQYKTCTKSLSCESVCPMKLPQAELISCLNHRVMTDLFTRR